MTRESAFIKSFKGFSLKEVEFPTRWTAQLEFNPPPHLLLLTPICARVLRYHHHLSLSLFFFSRTRSSPPFPRFLGNWIVASNSVQDHQKGVRGSFLCFFYTMSYSVGTVVSLESFLRLFLSNCIPFVVAFSTNSKTFDFYSTLQLHILLFQIVY